MCRNGYRSRVPLGLPRPGTWRIIRDRRPVERVFYGTWKGAASFGEGRREPEAYTVKKDGEGEIMIGPHGAYAVRKFFSGKS